MCGIVGAVADREVSGILLAGLQRLEYRGYDSAGVAVVEESQVLLHAERNDRGDMGESKGRLWNVVIATTRGVHWAERCVAEA